MHGNIHIISAKIAILAKHRARCHVLPAHCGQLPRQSWRQCFPKKDRLTTTFTHHLAIWLWELDQFYKKLEGVGPVDNRPSTNKLHHFVERKNNKQKCDMWHVTCDTWHMTCDLSPVTRDMLFGVNILSNFQLPSCYCLWLMILWRFGRKNWLTDWLTQLQGCL